MVSFALLSTVEAAGDCVCSRKFIYVGSEEKEVPLEGGSETFPNWQNEGSCNSVSGPNVPGDYRYVDCIFKEDLEEGGMSIEGEGGASGEEISWCFCYIKSDPANRKVGNAVCNSGYREELSKFCDDDIGYDKCVPSGSEEDCQLTLNSWKKENNLLGKQATQTSFIPDCAMYDDLTDACRDVSIFVTMLINIGRYLFAFVGSLVLLMLVLGGFQLIISQGNPEKVKKAKDIMVGAVLGLVVVFGAYVLVDFLGNTLGVQEALDINPSTPTTKVGE